MKKAIFWDFDGTLVYSEHMWSNCMYRILKRYWPDTSLQIEDLRSTGIVLYTWDEPEKDNRNLVGDAWRAYTEELFCIERKPVRRIIVFPTFLLFQMFWYKSLCKF